VLTFLFLQAEPGLSTPARTAAAIFIVVAAAGLGGLLDRRRWAWSLEMARLLAMPALGLWQLAPVAAGAATSVAVISAAWLWRLRGAVASAPSASAT
jgi:hypothetical protein